MKQDHKNSNIVLIGHEKSLIDRPWGKEGPPGGGGGGGALRACVCQLPLGFGRAPC